MQQLERRSSFEVDKETYVENQSHILKETESWEGNLDSIGKSDLGHVVFSFYETPPPSDPEVKLCPPPMTRRRSFNDHPHLLKVPSLEHDTSDCTPYQFDRHAPGRISTSPTLRRLRSSTSSISQVFPFQDSIDSTRDQKQKPDFSLPVCQNPPPSCSEYSSTSSYKNSLSLKDRSTSADSESILLHHKDDVSGDQMLQNAEGSNTSSLSEGEQNSQVYLQKLDSHKASLCRSAERRHSSVVVSLLGFEMFPGDLLIPDSAVEFLHHSASQQSSDTKKPWWPFAKKGTDKDKHKQILDLENCLSTVTIKISESSGYEFHSIKDKAWHEIMKIHQVEQTDTDDQLERKKQEAVWELFTAECTYFLEHLLVLKMIFMNTLKYLQSKEFFPYVDSGLLFGNLEELNQVSLSFVASFFSAIKDYLAKSTSSIDFISVLTKYFQGNLCQSHQIYCLNYTSAVFYLEKLKKREDFGIYLKWCEQNEQCKRLHLSELLVAPLHKLTRYPLLLKNIWKSTEAAEKVFISSITEKVETSIRDLEGKVKWLDNFQKFKQLQEIITWPPLWDQDKRFFVPECLRHILKDNPKENILSPTKRHLLHEGRLTLAENMRLFDVYLFLFDDLLLITKLNHHKKKPGGCDVSFIPYAQHFLTPELQCLLEEGGSCTVFDQPIPLDRVILRNIDSFHVRVFGLRNAFLIQHENRYQQCIAAFLLQAQTESIKKTWMSQMETAISNYTKRHISPQNSCFCFPAESSEI